MAKFADKIINNGKDKDENSGFHEANKRQAMAVGRATGDYLRHDDGARWQCVLCKQHLSGHWFVARKCFFMDSVFYWRGFRDAEHSVDYPLSALCPGDAQEEIPEGDGKCGGVSVMAVCVVLLGMGPELRTTQLLPTDKHASCGI